MTQYTRPTAGEYAEYCERYLAHLTNDHRDVLVLLEEQGQGVHQNLQQITDQQANHRYAPEKWSVKEVIGHLIDTERLFAFRALWIARGETNLQPGMDENLWAANSNAHARSSRDIGQEYQAARHSHLQLFRGFDPEALPLSGIVGGSATTVNALPWLIAAHEMHHLLVMRERYGIELI